MPENGLHAKASALALVVAWLAQLLYVISMSKAEIFSVDRIELLQTLVRIVETGSLSAAARQLGTSQPTVSRRLRSLEQLLDCRLLLRTTHQLKLTDEGERCYQRARQLLQDWQALTDDLNVRSATPSGSLRVRAPHAFGREQLLAPLLSYLAQWPELHIDWSLNDQAPDFLAEQVDCAIHVGPVTDPSLVAVLLAEVPRLVVAAPALLAARPPLQQVGDLAQLPWLAFSTYYRREVCLNRLDQAQTVRFAIKPRLSSDNLYVIRDAAKAGLGAALVSRWVVSQELENGTLQALFPQWQASPLPVYLVYPYARYYPARLTHFMQFIRDVMPDIAGLQPRQAAG